VLWRVNGAFYACEAECPHAGAPLVGGSVLDMEDVEQCAPSLSLSHAHARILQASSHMGRSDAPFFRSVLARTRSTTMGPMLSCPLHMFTWDLKSGAPVSALGCAAMKTFDVLNVLGSLYVSREPRGGASNASPGADDRHDSQHRRSSWRQ
jgi:nitrite reductase/ring-hydroxylating ferredoxin subunit